MNKLVRVLPDDVVQEKISTHSGHYIIWDNVVNEDGQHIIVLYLKSTIWPCAVEGFHFSNAYCASGETLRLNRSLGLSDTQIIERLDFVREREGSFLTYIKAI